MTNGSDPAFPLPKGADNIPPEVAGLTKREWFAGMMAQGAITIKLPAEHKDLLNPEIIARASVLMADALIVALSKEVKA